MNNVDVIHAILNCALCGFIFVIWQGVNWQGIVIKCIFFVLLIFDVIHLLVKLGWVIAPQVQP